MFENLGLAAPASWFATGAFAAGGLAALILATPPADRLASALTSVPPRLGAFRALQQSPAKLIAGIAIAWLLGGFLEEIVFRAMLLRWIETHAGLPMPAASILAIAGAAAGAGIVHLYQGPRGALIVAQLSVLFGLVYVLSGHDLWSVILCHGAYDTIAFVRFARGKSKYAGM
ncbi:MAG TPA: CPBP family intramembrane glutamic endopeptidase [Rhizomicrobium sp.]|nr:CPBP family intramembrane glutamic endopeptidase [Rhizomicrobium sp.]